nr:hypothetical protein [Tanacetum cinerariifolium]
VKDDEVKGLNAQLLLKEAEAAEAIRLRAKVSKFEVMEKSLQDETNALKERNAILEKEWNVLDAKDGLSAGITYDKEVRVLADVAAHNPFTEADYIFALQKL